MTSLGPTSRSLVAAAREGLGDPDVATAARVRARIAASIAGGAIVTTTSSTSASSVGSATGASAAIGSTAASSLALKLGLVVAVIGAVATTVVIDRTRSSPAGAPAIAAPAASDDEPRAPVHVATPETRPDPGRPALVSRPAARPGPGRPDLVRADVASGPTLAREVELIDRAMSELRLAQLATALQTIDVYERETAGHGQLGEDAAAIAIEAHCRLHDPVIDMLDVFDRTWPTSAQRTRLTAACSH